MRLGIEMRNPRRGDEHIYALKPAPQRINAAEARCLGPLPPCLAIVPAQHICAARHQSLRGDQARAAHSKHKDPAPMHALNCYHFMLSNGPAALISIYRTFNVARPIMAKTMAMIQKRITIWLSA